MHVAKLNCEMFANGRKSVKIRATDQNVNWYVCFKKKKHFLSRKLFFSINVEIERKKKYMKNQCKNTLFDFGNEYHFKLLSL